MSEPKYIHNLSNLIDMYDIFLIDVGGVIHDGIKTYDGALQALKTLSENNKKVILLTNAPRPKEIIAKKISDFGYTFNKEKIITSGDYFFANIKDHQLNPAVKKSAFILGGEKNSDLQLHNYYNIVDNIEEAQVTILLAYLDAHEDLNMYDYTMKEAIKLNIPAICPNPDTIVDYGETIRHPAGYFAVKYASFGGSVVYYGKPQNGIYEFSLQDMTFDKTRVLAIGDNLETDILGANNFGIDSILIRKGIYKDTDELDLLIEKHGIFPTYITDYFAI